MHARLGRKDPDDAAGELAEAECGVEARHDPPAVTPLHLDGLGVHRAGEQAGRDALHEQSGDERHQAGRTGQKRGVDEKQWATDQRQSARPYPGDERHYDGQGNQAADRRTDVRQTPLGVGDGHLLSDAGNSGRPTARSRPHEDEQHDHREAGPAVRCYRRRVVRQEIGGVAVRHSSIIVVRMAHDPVGYRAGPSAAAQTRFFRATTRRDGCSTIRRSPLEKPDSHWR